SRANDRDGGQGSEQALRHERPGARQEDHLRGLRRHRRNTPEGSTLLRKREADAVAHHDQRDEARPLRRHGPHRGGPGHGRPLLTPSREDSVGIKGSAGTSDPGWRVRAAYLCILAGALLLIAAVVAAPWLSTHG